MLLPAFVGIRGRGEIGKLQRPADIRTFERSLKVPSGVPAVGRRHRRRDRQR